MPPAGGAGIFARPRARDGDFTPQAWDGVFPPAGGDGSVHGFAVRE